MQGVVIQEERHPGQMKGDAAGSDEALGLSELASEVPTDGPMGQQHVDCSGRQRHGAQQAVDREDVVETTAGRRAAFSPHSAAMIAAAAMSFSSVSVIANSLRLRRQEV